VPIQAKLLWIRAAINGTSKFTQADEKAFRNQLPLVDKLLGDFGQICLQKNGDLLKYVGSAAAARDIISISDVLEGPGKLINYYGLRYVVSSMSQSIPNGCDTFSYGTIIGSYLVNSRLCYLSLSTII
jgi:hypothetical protein